MQELFDFQELRELTFDLGLDYEVLGEGLGKPERIIKLIEYMVRNGRLPDLLTGLKDARPHFNWPDIADLPQTADHQPILESQTLGQLYNVLPLPPNYLPRPQEIARLQTAVLRPKENTGQSGSIGLQGMGGIGKSVLAAAIAWDDNVRQYYRDGIFWISLGQTPALETRQKQLVDGLEPGTPTFHDVQEGRAQLSRTLANKQCLIILDDVWELEHATAFDVLAQSQSRLLISTRNLDILQALGADIHQVQLLDNNNALNLLAQAAAADPATTQNNPEAHAVVKFCGNLPLALAMVGAMVRGRPDAWNRALRRLERADLSRIKENFPHYPYPDLLRAIQVSVEALDDGDLAKLDPIDRYVDLAVFPQDTSIPLSVLERLWEPSGLDDIDTEDLVEAFVGRSLATLDEKGHLRLHDLNVNYVQQQAGSLQDRHDQLLESYQEATDDGTWPTGPNDGYFFQQLIYHLQHADRTDEIRDLLIDFEWLIAKLKATNVNELLRDYEVVLKAGLPDTQDFELIQGAIRLSSHILVQDANQLASQLLGRLLLSVGDNVEALMESIQNWQGEAWLRPLTGSLSPPGGPVIRTLQGHSEEISAVVVTTDQQHLISASKDKTIKVWDITNGMELLTLTGHSRPVNGLAVTPDGRYLLSTSGDKTVKKWDLASGTEVATWQGHTRIVNTIAVTPDGQRALSAGNDRTVKVWDAATGQQLASLEGHRDSVKDVTITPDGRYALSAADDRRIRIWDLTDYSCCGELEGHTSWVNKVLITANGQHILSASDDHTIKIWDFATQAEITTLIGHTSPVKALALTPDNQFAFSGSANGSVKLWNLSSGEEITTLPAHPVTINDLLVTADGRIIVTAATDATMRIGNVERTKVFVNLAEHRGGINGVAVTPDGQFGFTAAEDGIVKIWRLINQGEVAVLRGHEAGVQAIVVMPDGSQALTTANDGTIRIWDLQDYSEVRQFKNSSLTTAITPDGLAVTPDGLRGLSSTGSMVSVWDIETGEQQLALKWHASTVNGIEVTPDGKYALSASNDNKVKVWNLATGAETMALLGHTSRVNGVELTADGRFALSVSDDTTVKVWDLATGQAIHTYTTHTGAVHGIAIMPDQKRAISSAQDRTVRVWDIKTGQTIATFFADYAGMACAAASDGTILVGSANGRVHFLRLEE